MTSAIFLPVPAGTVDLVTTRMYFLQERAISSAAAKT